MSHWPLCPPPTCPTAVYPQGLDTMPEVTGQKTTRVILKEMFMNLKTKSV